MKSEKRNLLIVLAHGLRSDCLSDEREWPLPTPNLVGLGQRGLRLTLTSASPVDPGGMVSLITGRHPRQHGYVADDQPLKSLPELLPTWLADAGYHTVGVGEVGAMASALDEAIVTEGVAVAEPAPNRCWYTAAARSRGHGPALAQQRRQRMRGGPLAPDRLLLQPDEDIDGFITSQAAEAVARMPDDRPWAMFVVFSGPGNDLPPPMGYDKLLDPLSLERGFVPPQVENLDAIFEPELPRAVLQRLEAHHVARVRADYLGRVALIDHGVGELQRHLEQRADAERSWTVLTSDRGQLLGEQGLLGHRSLLAQTLEVPLVVAPPRALSISPPSPFTDGLYSTVDVAPTLAALAGADWPESLAGRSLLPIFHGQPVLPQPAGNLAEFHCRLMVENERYKAMFRIDNRRCQALFDLVADPEEKMNLMMQSGPETRRIVRHMRLKLAEVLMPLRA